MSLAAPFAVRSRSGEMSDARISGLIIALIAVLTFALSIYRASVLRDGDTWSHLVIGEWTMAHGAVPRVDIFSHSMPGAPWTAHEWLAEVLLALAFRGGSWSGVVLLTGLAAASAALILGLRVARFLDGAALGATVLLGVGLWTPSLLARPHILALPFAAAWVAGLLESRDRGRTPSLWLSLLMIVWSNLHGGFMFGLALVGPFALEALLEAPRGERVATLRGWLVFAAAATAASLVNPYGFEALLFPFRLMGVENLSRISEWQAEDFSHVGPLEIALLALLVFALTRPMAVPPVRTALVAALLAMALQHARHAQLLGLIAPMLLAKPMAKAIGAAPSGDAWRRAARAALAVSCAGVVGLGFLRLAEPVERVDGTAAPISALKAVPPDLKQKPVLNDYSFGGYLIWSHVRPFIDGRADMYGGAMLGLYRKLSAGDPATVEETLTRYHIAWTIFAPDAEIVATLDREPGWRRIYADPFAVVHARDDAEAGPIGLRGEQKR